MAGAAPQSGTVEWPGEIELDPNVLYGTHEPTGDQPLERRIVETASQVATAFEGPALPVLLGECASRRVA